MLDGPGGRDVFAEAVAQAVGLLRQAAAGCGGLDVSGREVRDRVGLALRAKAVVDGVLFTALRDVAARPEVVPDAGGDGARAARLLLVHAHRVDPRQAGRDVAAALALDPDTTRLPRFAAAYAEGAVTREHVDAGVSGVNQLPPWVAGHVLGDGTAAMDAIDVRLTEHATTLAPVAVKKVTAILREEVAAPAPDPGRRLRHGFEGRYLRYLPGADDDTGNLTAVLSLDPVTGAQVRAAIAAAVKHPLFESLTGSGVREDGEASTVKDRRSLAQRQADALAMLVTGAIPASAPRPNPPLPRTLPTRPAPTRMLPTRASPTRAPPMRTWWWSPSRWTSRCGSFRNYSSTPPPTRSPPQQGSRGRRSGWLGSNPPDAPTPPARSWTPPGSRTWPASASCAGS